MMEPTDRRLRIATIAFAVATAVHVSDHLRRGQGTVTDLVLALGNLALVFQVTAIVLVLTGHRLAPLVAAATGLVLAPGFAVTHWLPRFGPLSDPVWEVPSLPAVSAAASLAEIGGALAVGLIGLAIVRARGLATFALGDTAPAR